MQLTTSTRLMLTHPRIGRWHEDDDHHHLTKINHYTVAPRLRLRPSLNALVAMLVAMRLERLRPSPNLFFFTSPHSPRPRTPRTANRIRPIYSGLTRLIRRKCSLNRSKCVRTNQVIVYPRFCYYINLITCGAGLSPRDMHCLCLTTSLPTTLKSADVFQRTFQDWISTRDILFRK